MRGIMDFRGAWRSADFRIFIVFGLLHHVCGVDHSHSRFGHWTVMGTLQLVDSSWHSFDSRINFRYDYDDAILGNFLRPFVLNRINLFSGGFAFDLL